MLVGFLKSNNAIILHTHIIVHLHFIASKICKTKISNLLKTAVKHSILNAIIKLLITHCSMDYPLFFVVVTFIFEYLYDVIYKPENAL